MTHWLTDSQRDYVRSQPPLPGDKNKLRLALRAANKNQTELEAATGIARQQVSRYIKGRDLYLSMAMRLAAVFGLDVCDIWVAPPKATNRGRMGRGVAKRKVVSPSSRKSPKAVAA